MPSNLAPRVVPSLLISGGRLVKGRQFSDFREAGLAASTIKVLNAQDPDEIMLINISKTLEDYSKALSVISEAVGECDVPITVGGGIRDVTQASRLFNLGVEKVVITSHLRKAPNLLREVADIYGSQSVVAGIEYSEVLETEKAARDALAGDNRDELLAYAGELELLGAGELLAICISRDGMRTGLDIDFLTSLTNQSEIPVIGMGGVGNFHHLVEGFLECGLDAIGCGTLFTFGDNNPIRARSFLKNQGIRVRQ